jgi:hypothetical protein
MIPMADEPELPDEASDAAEFVARARQAGGRVQAELDRWAADLAQPWPRVAPDVLAEGSAAVDRAAAALRNLIQHLDDPSST